MIGGNATVTVEHLTQTRDPHGGKVDGAAAATTTTPAMISRSAVVGSLWKMTLAGNYGDIAKAPSEWRITDDRGRVFGPTKATYRPPIERIGESEHTLVFAELKGEVDLGEG